MVRQAPGLLFTWTVGHVPRRHSCALAADCAPRGWIWPWGWGAVITGGEADSCQLLWRPLLLFTSSLLLVSFMTAFLSLRLIFLISEMEMIKITCHLCGGAVLVKITWKNLHESIISCKGTWSVIWTSCIVALNYACLHFKLRNTFDSISFILRSFSRFAFLNYNIVKHSIKKGKYVKNILL